MRTNFIPRLLVHDSLGFAASELNVGFDAGNAACVVGSPWLGGVTGMRATQACPTLKRAC